MIFICRPIDVYILYIVCLLKAPLLFLQLKMKPNSLGDPIVPKQQGSYRLSEAQALAVPLSSW